MNLSNINICLVRPLCWLFVCGSKEWYKWCKDQHVWKKKVKICNNVSIVSHLLFAYDCFLFFRATLLKLWIWRIFWILIRKHLSGLWILKSRKKFVIGMLRVLTTTPLLIFSKFVKSWGLTHPYKTDLWGEDCPYL